MTTDISLDASESTAPLFHSHRMTETDYDRERGVLRDTYGDGKGSEKARHEQELAKLFHRSGWTQEQLAKKEGKSQPLINYGLRFGRFLDFITTGDKSKNLPVSLPHNLTERRFRDCWERTDKGNGNERIRYKQVIALLESEPSHSVRKCVIYSSLLKQFSDGQWHPLAEMADTLGATEADVKETLSRYKRHRRADVERKNVGASFSYRIFQTKKAVSTKELTEKLAPIIKRLMAEGKKSMATMSPATVDMLARELKKLVDGWNE